MDVLYGAKIPLRINPATVDDPTFKSIIDIAKTIAAKGGRLFISGGFVRDAVIAHDKGELLQGEDFDVEIYRMQTNTIVGILRSYGTINMVGASFQVMKLVVSGTGKIVDITIPRTDSKTSTGHKGFAVTGDPNLSIREASRRRDVTANSLLMDPLSGDIIDSWGGVADIRNKLLKAVDMELFADDPLRVLRIMQLAGRLEFDIEETTADLCRNIDLSTLSRERIGEEWFKLLLKSREPGIGLKAAKELGVLKKLHPELDILSAIEQEPEWHPEGNVWNHVILSVNAAAKFIRQDSSLSLNERKIVMLATLLHDIGKAGTTQVRIKHGRQRITSHGHEKRGAELAGRFLDSLAVPRQIAAATCHIVREHLYHVHSPNPSDAAIKRFSIRLQPATIKLWDIVARADANGRGELSGEGSSRTVYERAEELSVAKEPPKPIVQGRHLLQLGLKPGPHLGVILRQLYDAQIEGKFSTLDDAIAFAKKLGI